MRDADILSDRRESREPVHVPMTIKDPLTGQVHTKTLEIDGPEWAILSPTERLEHITQEQHAWAEEALVFDFDIEGAHTLDDPTTEF